ncbi:MAG TPA: spore germination protein [Clostridiales bacterium]|nr:spore germination protein [Clostridiales bacterium]
MYLTNSLEENLIKLKSILKVDESFDILERVINIKGEKFHLFFVDGFVKDVNFEYIRRDMYNIKKEDFISINSATDLIEKAISSIETSTERDVDKIVTSILSGQTAMLGMDFDEAIIIDLRTYPTRSIGEPEQERVLRGSHDGFVETIVFNTALIRRRIRDANLIFEMYSVGNISKTDVAVGYLKGKVNKKILVKVKKYIDELDIQSLTLGDQSLVEVVQSKSWINPYPRVRFTERPDVAAAQIIEGDVVILIDNTPSVLILPSNIFSFFQSVDDYYMPVFTGNYLKLVRTVVLIVNIFLTPIFILIVENPNWLRDGYKFLLPTDVIKVPLYMQFLIMEIAVDGLKIASLNTPSALGTSLSIIGGLILGDYAVKTGWFVPQSIFYMAIVALSSFVQPSIEFSYAVKFSRIILIIFAGLLGFWGFIGGIILNLLIIATTKTFSGASYLYPLMPFKWKALKKQIFRWKKEVKKK